MKVLSMMQRMEPLHLYSAALPVDGWRGDDDTGYTQTVNCTPEKEGSKRAGPPVTADTQLGIPMVRPTGMRETDEAMQAALGIINSGTVTPGYGLVTAKVWERPETAITVYWYGR